MVFMQEPHKAAYKYFLELIAGLKHMISTRVSRLHICSLVLRSHKNNMLCQLSSRKFRVGRMSQPCKRELGIK